MPKRPQVSPNVSMPLSYGMPLWRSPRLRWEISQAMAITRNTKETPAKAKPTTYQMRVIVLQQALFPRWGVRGVGAKVHSGGCGAGFDARSLAIHGRVYQQDHALAAVGNRRPPRECGSR